jgi:hypothetical protein
VRAAGTFERELRIAGERVELAGEIRQPVQVVAHQLHILPTARIEGPLTYDGATPATIAAGATIAHPITYRHIASSQVEQARWPRGASSLVFAVHLFVGGLLLLLLMPRIAGDPATAMRAQPVQSLFAGLMLMVTVPFVAVLLIVSLVGLPSGLALAALYAALLFLGIVITALVIGEAEASWLRVAPTGPRGGRLVFLLAGVVTLAVLRSLPVVGSAVVVAAVVFGIGAVGLWVYRTYVEAPLSRA